MIRHRTCFIHSLRPASFLHSGNVVKLELLSISKGESRPLMRIEVLAPRNQLQNVLKLIRATYIFLSDYVLIESFVFNVAVNAALHHCRSVVVFYVAFPAWLWHKAFVTRCILLKALFPEVFNRIIVSICQEVIYVALNGVVFEFVH